MHMDRMKTLAVALILCGVAFLVYNVFNFYPSYSGITSAGMRYSAEAKAGIAVGAVLFVGGVLLYREGDKRASLKG